MFVIDWGRHAFVFTDTFISSLSRTHGTTAVDFVLGVLVEVVVEAGGLIFNGTAVIERIRHCMIDSSFSQSLKNRESSVFTSHHINTLLSDYGQSRGHVGNMQHLSSPSFTGYRYLQPLHGLFILFHLSAHNFITNLISGESSSISECTLMYNNLL